MTATILLDRTLRAFPMWLYAALFCIASSALSTALHAEVLTIMPDRIDVRTDFYRMELPTVGPFKIHLFRVFGPTGETEIATESSSYSYFFSEYCHQTFEGDWGGAFCCTGMREPTADVLVNSAEAGIVRLTWDLPNFHVEHDLLFYAHLPELWVETHREARITGVYSNAQNCTMLNGHAFDASWILKPEGTWLANMAQDVIPPHYPTLWLNHCFAGIDYGGSTLFPTFVWSRGGDSLTAAVVATWVVPEQHPTFSYHGGGKNDMANGSSFAEGQWNWWGRPDNGAVEIQEGTRYGFETAYMLGYGGLSGVNDYLHTLPSAYAETLTVPPLARVGWGGEWPPQGGYPITSPLWWLWPTVVTNLFSTQDLDNIKSLNISLSRPGTRTTALVKMDATLHRQSSTYSLLPASSAFPGWDSIYAGTEKGQPMGGLIASQMGWHHRFEMIMVDSTDLLVSGAFWPDNPDSVDFHDSLTFHFYATDRIVPSPNQLAGRDGDYWDFAATDRSVGPCGFLIRASEGVLRLREGTDVYQSFQPDAAETLRYQYLVRPYVQAVRPKDTVLTGSGDCAPFRAVNRWMTLPGLRGDTTLAVENLRDVALWDVQQPNDRNVLAVFDAFPLRSNTLRIWSQEPVVAWTRTATGWANKEGPMVKPLPGVQSIPLPEGVSTRCVLTRTKTPPDGYEGSREVILDLVAGHHLRQLHLDLPPGTAWGEGSLEFYDLQGVRILSPYSIGFIGEGHYLLRLDPSHRPSTSGLYLWVLHVGPAQIFSGRFVMMR